jgi:DNA-binding beta-propeller fold protein YncE
MIVRLVAAALLAVAAPIAASLAQSPPLTRSDEIPLPGVAGRIDHLALDSAGRRLYIAALGNGSAEAVDLSEGKVVARAPGLKEPQGIVYMPDPPRVVVSCGGDGTVRSLDAGTLAEIGRADAGEDADNLRFDPLHSRLIVGCGDGALVILDAATLSRQGAVKLPAHPEAFVLDPDGRRAWANVPGGFVRGGGSVVAIDLEERTVTATWALGDAGRNFPMAIDPAGRRLYIGCRRPARLLVMDALSGKVSQSIACVGDADDVFYDAVHGRVYVSGGDGRVDVFTVGEGGTLAAAASVRTADGARTSLLTPDCRTLFVACPAGHGSAARVLRLHVEP